jgi:hypothetical protein
VLDRQHDLLKFLLVHSGEARKPVFRGKLGDASP